MRLNTINNYSHKAEILIEKLQLELEHEKKLRDIMDKLLEGIQIIGSDWRYLYVNDVVVNHSKFSREELLGYTMMEKYPGIENTKLFNTLGYCMKERVALNFENEFNYPDGSVGWFDLSIQPCEEGLTILSNEITGRKRSEREKKQYYDNLEHVLFKLSHQVRQPVVQIMGLINLLDKKNIRETEIAEIIGFIQQSVLAMDKYTRDITNSLDDMRIKSKTP